MTANFRSSFAVLFFLFTALTLAQTPQTEPYRVGDKVTKPEKIAGDPPVYPEAARKAGLDGAIIVEAIIDERGNVINSRVLKGLPLGLNQAAMDAVETWKFKPATLDGQPVKVYYTVTVNFTMKNKADGFMRVLGSLLNENPELESLIRSKRFPEALAYLEGRPPTPETRVGRCVVLAGQRRFGEALTEARAYGGPAPEQLLQFIALTALQTVDGHLLTEQVRAETLDAGIQAATEALGIHDGYRQAMHTKSRLLREKAELAVDPQRAALLSEADDLEKRAASSP